MNSSRLRLLAALDVFLDEVSVSRAAVRLGVSQPAASRLLAGLREAFDDPLLVRSGRSLVLTAFARDLAPRVRGAMAGLEAVFGEARPFEPKSIGRRFVIGVTDTVGPLVFPRVLGRLALEAPGLKLRLTAAPTTLRPSDLAEGLDLVIDHHDLSPESLRAVTLYRQPMVVAARRGFPLPAGRLDLETFLAAEHVVVFPHAPAMDVALREVFEGAGRPFRLMVSTQQLATAAAIAAQRDCLCLMTRSALRLHAEPHGLKALDLPPGLNLPETATRMVWHERNHRDPESAWLRRVIRECAKAAVA